MRMYIYIYMCQFRFRKFSSKSIHYRTIDGQTTNDFDCNSLPSSNLSGLKLVIAICMNSLNMFKQVSNEGHGGITSHMVWLSKTLKLTLTEVRPPCPLLDTYLDMFKGIHAKLLLPQYILSIQVVQFLPKITIS